MKWRLRRTSDSGAILVIALFIITVVAVVTGLVMTRGDSSLRATVTLRKVAGATYSADGAAQVAINGLRTGFNKGNAEPSDWVFRNGAVPGNPGVAQGCFGYNSDATVINGMAINQQFYPVSKSTGSQTLSAYVKCKVENDTGEKGEDVLITDENRPGHAVLTLGTGGETGLETKTNNNKLWVRGTIQSNSNIIAQRPIQVDDGQVKAHTTCTGTITPACIEGASTVNDPDYLNDLAVTGSPVPPLQQVPPCGTGAYVAFNPGYYDDVKALENITTTCNKVIWFKPGTYYFDFHNNSSDPAYENGVFGSASDSQWDITVGKIVAGTPVDAAGNRLAFPPPNPTIPGSCENPIDTANAEGVQFIFGGDSHMYFDKRNGFTYPLLEMCGSYHPKNPSDPPRPPIVIFGQKSGGSQRTVLREAAGDDGDPIVGTAATGTPGTFANVSPANLSSAGGTDATWTRTSNGNPSTGTITLTNFAPPSTIPPGAVLKAATLRVKHSETIPSGTASASSVVITPTGGSAMQTVNLPIRATSQFDEVQLNTNSSWATLQDLVHDNGFAGATIAFTGNNKKDQTTSLDAVRLELEYYLPQVRGQNTAAIPGNCLTILGGGCALVETANNFPGQIYLQGTTYVPASRLHIELSNQTKQIFRFGVIARSLYVDSTGQADASDPLIELPDNSPGWGKNGTILQLEVYLCPGQTTCDSSDPKKLALTTRVLLWDQGVPVPNHREVTVLSWSHTR